MAYGWTGSKVRLVPADKEEHFENALRWINDPEITRWTLIGDFPIARLAEEEWFDNMSKRMESTEIFFAIETLDGEHIGFSGIHRIDWRNGTGTTGTIIGAKELWGQGYGSDAARTRTHYAFEVLGLRMIARWQARKQALENALVVWRTGSPPDSRYCPILNVSTNLYHRRMIEMARTIEVFTAGCPLCKETLQRIHDAVASCGCTVVERAADSTEAQQYGITAIPAIVVNGQRVFTGQPTAEQVVALLRQS